MNNLRILIAEDNLSWRSEISEILSESGHRVVSTSSYPDAYTTFRHGDFDLVIIDLNLESNSLRMEGHVLLEEAFSKGIPSIVVSGFDDPGNVKKAYQYETLKFLSKRTFSFKEFQILVDRVAERVGMPPRPPSAQEQENFKQLMRELVRDGFFDINSGA